MFQEFVSKLSSYPKPHSDKRKTVSNNKYEEHYKTSCYTNLLVDFQKNIKLYIYWVTLECKIN